MSGRERILARLREAAGASSANERAAAVAETMRAHPISPRPHVAADGANLAVLFRAQALNLSSTLADVTKMADVPAAVAVYLHQHGLPLQAVCWTALHTLDWAQHGMQVEARAATADDAVGITGVFCAIAETGTLMTLSGARTPPATSLLPHTHIVVLRLAQIVPAMEEAWQRLRDAQSAQGVTGEMPRAVNFISGPSRTADIEQTVTLGAHGPYRVHIILVAESGVNT